MDLRAPKTRMTTFAQHFPTAFSAFSAVLSVLNIFSVLGILRATIALAWAWSSAAYILSRSAFARRSRGLLPLRGHRQALPSAFAHCFRGQSALARGIGKGKTYFRAGFSAISAPLGVLSPSQSAQSSQRSQHSQCSQRSQRYANYPLRAWA